MEQNVASAEALRKATYHLQQLLLSTTPGKTPQTAHHEAQAIASLAFENGNPVKELFTTATPRAEQYHRPRSTSPAATIRPKSSKLFSKFGRSSRDKSNNAGASSSAPKQSGNAVVSELFEQMYGPFEAKEPKKPKRKERASDASPPASSSGPSKVIPSTASFSSQPKHTRNTDQYKCIVCDTELSSKGVCKRHLEDQHITPKVYECEGCRATFDTKPEAKKHCGQCGTGELSYVQKKLHKKLYACEYTGAYYCSLERYALHLLSLSEKQHNRPRPNLNLKLEAIFKHEGFRNTALKPLCGKVSQNLFDDSEAWKHLKWDEEFLRNKISVLEHATFNEDGTMESARWTGSSLKRRNTETFLTQLFQKGRLPSQGSCPVSIKPDPMSVASTPMPMSHTAPSISSQQSSTNTPLHMTSPMGRPHSRQTVWSHDGMDQSTSATTPRSAPGDEQPMTAELKSKRHLSDESRAYIPARTPPGPPDPSEHYQSMTDADMQGDAPQLPPLPAFMTPSNSTVSLPLRKQEELSMAASQNMVSAAQYHNMGYHMHPSQSSHTLSSDLGSETSTLAQSYREPELQHDVSIDYDLWAHQQQQLAQAYQQHGPGMPLYHGQYGGGFDYSLPDDASSMVASSVHTGQTINVDYVTEIPKMDAYGVGDMDIGGGQHPHVETFYMGDEGDMRRENAMR